MRTQDVVEVMLGHLIAPAFTKWQGHARLIAVFKLGRGPHLLLHQIVDMAANGDRRLSQHQGPNPFLQLRGQHQGQGGPSGLANNDHLLPALDFNQREQVVTVVLQRVTGLGPI